MPSARADASAPTRDARAGILRNTVYAGLATAATQGPALLRMFLGAKLLGAPTFGIWLGLRLIVDYGANLDAGVLTGALRQIPLLRGAGDDTSAELVRRTAFSFVLGGAAIGAAILVAVAAFAPGVASRTVLLLLAALVFANQIKAYYVTQVKASHRFRDASISSLVGGAVTLVSLPLISLLGLEGFVLGMIAQVVAEALCLALMLPLPRLGLRPDLLRQLLAFGIPATGITFLSTAITSIDRTVILARLDAAQLGSYGIAFIAQTTLMNAASAPNAVLYPRLSERFGETGRPEALLPILRRPLVVMSVCFAGLVGAGALALPLLVHLLLPKYEGGVRAAQIMLFGAYAHVGIGVVASCLVSLKRLYRYGAAIAGASALTYALALGLVRVAPRLEAVAAGCALGLHVYSLGLTLIAFRAMGQPLLAGLRSFVGSTLPLAWAAAARTRRGCSGCAVGLTHERSCGHVATTPGRGLPSETP